jgi:5-oxoprolinase (ATP-hydrolysing) subunit A
VTSVDLNADVGEGAGSDDVLLDLVTSASVACGVHAGDRDTMRRTLDAAARRGVVVGAHPSYPDRAGFGRRPLAMAPAQITDEVLSQVLALEALAAAGGARVRFVKPHGALYLRMAEDESCAAAVAEAVQAAGDLVLLAPAGSPAIGAAAAVGVRVATEAFADRAYRPDGRLAPRSDPGAVIDDPAEAARRALRIAVDHLVTAVDGTVIDLSASSICVHSDTPGAATLAAGVRAALEGAGVTVEPFVS